MTYLTKRHLSRRALLRGAGAALALPLLDSMIPAMTAEAKTAAKTPPRFFGGFVPWVLDDVRWDRLTAGDLLFTYRSSPTVDSVTRRVFVGGRTSEVSGAGYAPEGSFDPPLPLDDFYARPYQKAAGAHVLQMLEDTIGDSPA